MRFVDSHLRQLARDTFGYGLSVVLGRMVAFLIVPLFAHYLTPEEFGAGVLFTSISIVLVTGAAAGQDIGLIRWYWLSEEERDRKRTVASSAWAQIAFTGAVAAGMAACAVPLAHALGGVVTPVHVLIAAATLPGMAMQRVLQVWLRSRRRPLLLLAVTAVAASATLSVTLLLVVWLDEGLTGVLLANLASSLTVTLIAVAAMRDWLSPRHLERDRLVAMLKFGVPTVPGAMAIWVIDLSDRFFVRYFESAGDVARYQLASTIAAVTSLSVAAFEQAWVPYSVSVQNEPDARTFYRRTLTTYVAVVGALALAISLFAREAISVVAPDYYQVPGVVVPLLAFGFLMIGLRDIGNTGAMLAGSQVGSTAACVAGAIANVALNILLIPQMGIAGAALSTIASQFVTVVFTFRVSQRLHPIPYGYRAASLLVVLGLMLAFLRLSLDAANLVVAVAANLGALAVFAAAVLASGAVPARRLSALREQAAAWWRG